MAEEAAAEEKRAAGKLRLARRLFDAGKPTARKRLQEVVDEFEGTDAAKEAAALLKKLPTD